MHFRIAYFTPVLVLIALAVLGISAQPRHAEGQVLLPPVLTKDFALPAAGNNGAGTGTIVLGTPVNVRIRTSNPNVTNFDVSYTDTLPAGMTIAGAASFS